MIKLIMKWIVERRDGMAISYGDVEKVDKNGKDEACKLYGRRFYFARTMLGIDQQDAAKLVGLSQAQLSMIENGNSEPKARTLIAYSKLYGCSVDFLLGLTDETDLRGGKRIRL